MSYKEFIKLPMALFVILICKACCTLPFVDCGPVIVPIKIKPSKVYFNNHIEITQFKGWYYSTRSNDKNTVRIECHLKLNNNFEILFEPNNTYYLQDNEKIIARNIIILKDKQDNNMSERVYNFEFHPNDIKFPTSIYIDAVLLVNSQDSVHQNIKLQLLKNDE